MIPNEIEVSFHLGGRWIRLNLSENLSLPDSETQVLKDSQTLDSQRVHLVQHNETKSAETNIITISSFRDNPQTKDRCSKSF